MIDQRDGKIHEIIFQVCRDKPSHASGLYKLMINSYHNLHNVCNRDTSTNSSLIIGGTVDHGSAHRTLFDLTYLII